MKAGYVYIMTNGPSGTLYIGATAYLAGRVMQHREGRGSSFCKQWGLTRLVYAERHESIDDAMNRELQMKKWKRGWKLNLIGRCNPDWRDLFEDYAHE